MSHLLLKRLAPAPYFHPFMVFQFLPLRGKQSKFSPPPLGGGERGLEVRTMITLILDANNSIIYTTYCHMQFNCKFLPAYDFLLKLKICMDKNFYPWSSNKFPDFPWLPCPCWLVEIPRSQTKICGFSWTPLDIPLPF